MKTPLFGHIPCFGYLRTIANGIGLSEPETAVGGRGLARMRSRAERLAATLRVDSTPDRGTTVALHVPNRLAMKPP